MKNVWEEIARIYSLTPAEMQMLQAMVEVFSYRGNRILRQDIRDTEMRMQSRIEALEEFTKIHENGSESADNALQSTIDR